MTVSHEESVTEDIARMRFIIRTSPSAARLVYAVHVHPTESLTQLMSMIFVTEGYVTPCMA